MSEITPLLNAAKLGAPHASSDLLPLVYDELRHLAAFRLASEPPGQTLQPTALVHEAWLRLASDGERNWESQAHFLNAAALAMRRILVNIARSKKCIKRFHGTDRIDINDAELHAPQPDERLLAINDALDHLEQADPDSARLLVFKYFGGFTNQEIARLHEVSERTIERQLTYAKSILFALIRSEIKNRPEAAAPGGDTVAP